MSRPIPLVRAAAVAPILNWMHDHGLSWQARLRAAGLPATLLFEPERPVALLAGVRFLTAAAETEGADIGCRVVSDRSIGQLSSFGQVALASRSPREALTRLIRAYPHHSSHELFAMSPGLRTTTVYHRFLVDLDDAALHACHQYVAAIVRALTAGTGGDAACLEAVALTPHPARGLGHLVAPLQTRLAAASDRALTLTLRNAVLDRCYLRPPCDPGLPNLAPIRGDGSLTYSLRAILPGILEHGPATVVGVADLAGTSARTLQRRLAAEGTSLSDEVDRLRREQALVRIVGGREPVGAIAADLGYSDQSSFTRAMRRWTDQPPSRLRSG